MVSIGQLSVLSLLQRARDAVRWMPKGKPRSRLRRMPDAIGYLLPPRNSRHTCTCTGRFCERKKMVHDVKTLCSSLVTFHYIYLLGIFHANSSENPVTTFAFSQRLHSTLSSFRLHCTTCTMVTKGLRLDLGTKVYRTVLFVHTGYAVDSTQSINTSLVSYKKQNKNALLFC
jgi:hypothetical protein